MTRQEGGRGHGSTAVALVLAFLAVAANAGGKRASRPVAALATLLPISALLMCLVSPTGWYGADDAASYTLAALTVLAVVGYARTADRRLIVVLTVCVAGLVEFGEAFLPWWGGEDPSVPMTGTFYWWNPFAAFLLPSALLGAALALRGGAPWRSVGWIVAPLSAAGIVFSSSRMTTLLLVAGFLGLILLALARATRRAVLLRWLLLAAVTVGVVFGLSGPPVFPQRASVTAAAEAKADSGQSVAQNTTYRLEFWKRALAVVEDRPVIGSGPHALVGASDGLVPSGYARSNLVHNGYLQALSDGGLLLGLPFLLGCAGCLLAGVRLLLSARTQQEDRWLRTALPIALAAAGAHSAVDFDWSHPSDLVLSAVLAGLVLSFRTSGVTSRRWAPVVLLGALVPVMAVAAWHWDDTKRDVASTGGSAEAAADHLRALGSQPFRDYRWPAGVLTVGVGRTGPILDQGVPQDDLEWALEHTSRIGSVAPDIQLLRARALVVLGRPAQAADIADELVAHLGRANSGPIADKVAYLLDAAGRPRDARSLLAQFLVASAQDEHAGEHLYTLLDLDRGEFTSLDRCAYASVEPALRPQHLPNPGPPAVGVSCNLVLLGATS